MSRNICRVALGLASWVPALVCAAGIFYGPTELSGRKEESATIYGPAIVSNSTFSDSLIVMGPLEIVKTTVERSCEIMGPVNGGVGSRLNDLKVSGPVSLSQSEVGLLTIVGALRAEALKVQGKMDIVGPLEAIGSTFGDIFITSDKIFLKDTTVANLTVRAKEDSLQTVILSGTTKVSGVIRFESGNGKLILEGNNTQHGTVEGASNTETRPLPEPPANANAATPSDTLPKK